MDTLTRVAKQVLVPCEECGIGLSADSDLRIELTYDDELLVYCLECWSESSATSGGSGWEAVGGGAAGAGEAPARVLRSGGQERCNEGALGWSRVRGRKTIDDLLNAERAGVQRVTPEEAFAEVKDGAVLVDIRSEDERDRQGYLAEAIHHPLSVVLWRLDPDEPTSNPKLALDTRVLLICREGYSSSLAAAQLREIGFQNATDVIGGVDGWIEAGLKVDSRTPRRRRGGLRRVNAPALSGPLFAGRCFAGTFYPTFYPSDST